MKVLDLRCANGHVFEGWFASDDDYVAQNGRGLVACPLCADQVISRMLSAPRLNLSGARAPREAHTEQPAAASADAAPTTPSQTELLPADMQALWLRGVRELMARTEDVGQRFSEEARRIHYGESPQRGIRGQATPEERAALHDEGIETVSIPVPAALKGPLQ
jgi:hypothetical protein